MSVLFVKLTDKIDNNFVFWGFVTFCDKKKSNDFIRQKYCKFLIVIKLRYNYQYIFHIWNTYDMQALLNTYLNTDKNIQSYDIIQDIFVLN